MISPGTEPVRIGAGSAFRSDSRTGIAQLLRSDDPPGYIIFDFLAEAVMGGLGRARLTGAGPGYAAEFIDGYLLPHLPELLSRGIRVIANAGGLDPAGCARQLAQASAALGLTPRIGQVAGDDLTARFRDLVDDATVDLFDGSAVKPQVTDADQLNSLSAYTGAFPIATLLDAGADIVITGRAVDSALVLGVLIHEFGWGPNDLDLLAAGTLAGHLIECSAQVTGGTFTDWQAVPDWANIGMPIAECRADGTVVITKPDGTGGLVSVGTVAEQLLYEVGDPRRYIVPDVVCDFSQVHLESVGPDRVAVSGARGAGRTDTYKATATFDRGWRASAMLPIIGMDAAAKARRTAAAVFQRSSTLLADRGLAPFDRTHCDVIGDESTVVCRMVADHPQRAGAEVFAREQATAISHMSVGTSLGLGQQLRPVQHLTGFLLPKHHVALTATLDGSPVDVTVAHHAIEIPPLAPAPAPPAPIDDPATTVPLIALAWARSGDKGNLFNVAVIARDPAFLPSIASALTPESVGSFFGRLLRDGSPYVVDVFSAPGPSALNFVVHDSLDGGMLASPSLDPAAKGMAQLLLEYPIPVSAEILAALPDQRENTASVS